MSNLIRPLRSEITGAVPAAATAAEAGELAVNIADRKVFMRDSTGAAVPVAAKIEAYSAARQYEVDDLVVQAGTIQRCDVAVTTPEAFDAAKWTPLGTAAGGGVVILAPTTAGENTITTAGQPAITALTIEGDPLQSEPLVSIRGTQPGDLGALEVDPLGFPGPRFGSASWRQGVATHPFSAVGQAAAFDGTTWTLAQAGDPDLQVVALVQEIIDVNTIVLRAAGLMTDLSPSAFAGGLVIPGRTYYVSSTVPGQLTSAPGAESDIALLVTGPTEGVVTIPNGIDGAARASIGPTFPVDPGDGFLFYKTTETVGLYIYLDDGDSQQWVQAGGSNSAAAVPTEFDDVEALKLTTFEYTDGTIITTRKEQFSYVADSTLAESHLPVASGAKLRFVPGADGFIARAFGAGAPGATDDTVALNRMFSCGGRQFFLPAGRYPFSDTLRVPNGALVTGAGRGITVLDGSAAEPGTFISHATHMAIGEQGGTYVPLPALAADLVEGDDIVDFAAAHGMEKGDVFYVLDPNDNSLTNYRPNYRMGDLFEVDKVKTSTRVKVTKPHRFPITSAAGVCGKHTGDRGGGLRDFTLLCYPDEDTLTVGIKAAGQVNYDVSNIEVRDPHFVGVFVTEGSYDFTVDGCTVLCTADSAPNNESLQYCIVAGAVSRGRITNNYAVGGRHAIDGGDSTGDIDVCATDIFVGGNDTYARWRGSISTHGQCIGWRIIGNKATGIVVRGGDHIATGNEIVLRQDTEGEAQYTCISVSEIWSPNNIVADNTIVCYDTRPDRGWLLDWGGNSDGLDDGTKRSGVFTFGSNNILLKAGADEPDQSAITVVNRGATGIGITLNVRQNTLRSEGAGNVFVVCSTASGDKIWRVFVCDNDVQLHAVCNIGGALYVDASRNTCRSSPAYGMRINAADVAVVNGNNILKSGDQGIFVRGDERVVAMGNVIDEYHLTSAAGGTALNNALTLGCSVGGRIVLKDNVAMRRGAFAPADTFGIFSTGGNPAFTFVAGNVDADQGTLRLSGIPVSGPEEPNLKILSGATRHELTAPSGILEIDGTVVGTQT